ncbi:uncharacterized protein LOC129598224 [Paramacrobiotus metropolitanus]|uniref:uncharacterized protein LOC129598224 n=1 Tax=Paramacrobiotus metropolitanus TaxID=2943436 RepID=UPI002445F026|nr:uncharacterized protein LOC129598224 [Paramacrobiotus metropolitanus]
MALGNDVIQVNLHEIVGSGRQGVVCRATRMDTNEIVAVKLVNLSNIQPEARLLECQELTVRLDGFLSISHRHLLSHIKHQTILTDSPTLNPIEYQILMEYCSGGALNNYVRFNVLPYSLLPKWTKQILSGLVYLHEQNWAHRDIKGGNIFLSSPNIDSCDLKIGDLQDMKRMVERTTHIAGAASGQGTCAFMSPEIAHPDGMRIGRRTDIWSLGCVVIQMVTGEAPRLYRGTTLLNTAQSMMYFLGTGGMPALPAGLPPLLRQFIERCLQRDVADRPHATDLENDAFLADYNNANLPNRATFYQAYEPIQP